MADVLPAEHYTKTSRSAVAADGAVLLSVERWQWLVDFIRVNYADTRSGPEIKVHEATNVNGILFLPALYRPA